MKQCHLLCWRIDDKYVIKKYSKGPCGIAILLGCDRGGYCCHFNFGFYEDEDDDFDIVYEGGDRQQELVDYLL